MISVLLVLDTSIDKISPPIEFGHGQATSTSLVVKKEGCAVITNKAGNQDVRIHAVCFIRNSYKKH